MNTDKSKIYLREIIPNISPDQLFAQHKKCYVGISLHNPRLKGNNLRTILNWTTAQFDKTLVIVGDLLQRYNKIFLENMTLQEATNSAISEGDIFLQEHEDILRSFEEKKIRIRRWSELLESNDFLMYKSVLSKLSKKKSEFHEAIQEDANGYIKNRITRGDNIKDISLSRELSCKYLLEEIAVFAVLVSEGWTVDVYPGPELSALKKIASGKINGIPNIFGKRVNIEIGFK